MSLRIVATTPAGFPASGLVHAAYAAGHHGALCLEACDWRQAQAALDSLFASDTVFSVFVRKLDDNLLNVLSRGRTSGLQQVIFTDASSPSLPEQVGLATRLGFDVRVQVTSLSQAFQGEQLGIAGLVVKGNESGGAVGEETTFILLQQILPRVSLPVWVRGGVGLHSAAACYAAGTEAVVLDWQLGLCEESELPGAVRARIARMDGSETAILGQDWGSRYRAYIRPGETAVGELRAYGDHRGLTPGSPGTEMDAWHSAVFERVSKQELLLIGQDACFANDLAERYRTAGRICDAIQHESLRACRVGGRLDPLREGGPLAQALGTRYGIVQGPMTRVSDRADFALGVADAGALPFLALALMPGTQVGSLLQETKEKLGSKPWGIGILGFVPKDLRDQQLAEAKKYSPPFAIIAGGRPDQAKELEAAGTQTYLHVPSPELLRSFLESGSRKVIFEGRECGGHVGPRTSLVLWDSMIRVILKDLSRSEARGEDYHVLFAGGIHDGLSGAMVSAMTAPLSERGVRVGVLIGTAYLFTEEAVTSGAITSCFQAEALKCSQTILLETGVGHSTRCAESPFGQQFIDEKRKLLQQGRAREEIREQLEHLNLGRLRIAAKGVTRSDAVDASKASFVFVSEEEQRNQGMFMIGQAAALRREVCTAEDMHKDVASAGEILRRQARTEVLQARSGTSASVESRSGAFAIVGLSSILPKATDVRQYWHNILNKVNGVAEVPKERWDVDLYFDADRRARDKVYSRWGGFIGDTVFDPARYGMPPNSVSSVEPMQLLTLDIARQALADASYSDRRFDRERTSVIVGTGGGVGELGLGYGFRSLIPHFVDHAGGTLKDSAALIEMLDGQLPEWTEDSFAGLLLNVVAGRIANRLDLGGTNYIVDAACATSLAALRLGLSELESGSSDAVIVASSDMMQTPFGYLCFSKTQALSPLGQCRTFDEAADGIVISEGIAAVVIKRLEDAEQDGDRIYALIRSVGASSDGKDKGLTAPRPIGQIRALERAYQKAGVDPATVGLVEAHGTGTVVGDRSEVESLTTFFRAAGADLTSCALGSVKSLIGHTKCTAGFAGLIKAALGLHHRILPPTGGISKPNAKADFPATPFFLNTEATPWFRRLDSEPRRAGVSAFGFGGTNFHAVLEEHNPAEGNAIRESPVQDWPAELFLWRSDRAQAIEQSCDVLMADLEAGAAPLLPDLAAAVCWQHSQQQGKHCLAVVASSLEDLKTKLATARTSLRTETGLQDPRGVYYSPSAVPAGKIAFLFPGQGSQRVRMMNDLALAFPVVRETFEQADSALQLKAGHQLTKMIFPPPTFSEEEKVVREAALRQTRIAQPSLGAADIAMHRLLKSLAIRPDMAAGHSYGELAALCAAGACEFADLIRLSEARGRLIVDSAGDQPGKMAAIDASEQTVSSLIEGLDGVWIANLNAPAQTVIAGTDAGITAALARSASRGLNGRAIPVACAFHSPIVAGARNPLRKELAAVTFAPPRYPVYSNTTSQPHSDNTEALRDCLSDHLVKPVRFAEEIQAMYDAGARIFIECGPGKVLTGLASQTLGQQPHAAVVFEQNGRNGLLQLVHALSQLAVAGVPFTVSRLFEGRLEASLQLTKLLEQSRPTPLSSTAWVVSAGRSFPAQKYLAGEHRAKPKSPATTQTYALLRDPDSSNPDSSNVVTPSKVNGFVPSSPSVALSQPVAVHVQPAAREAAAAVGSISGTRDRVSTSAATTAVSKHRQLMSQFLKTHGTVMLAGLEAGGGATPIASNGHTVAKVAGPAGPQIIQELASSLTALVEVVSVPLPVAVQVLTPQATKTASVLEPSAPALPMPDNIRARLLEVVSQRTGYPTEMLDFELDLEADLGIDSIKRVEIFGELQTASLLPAQSEETDIEALSKLKTLGAILAVLLNATPAGADLALKQLPSPLGDVVAPAPSTPNAVSLTRLAVRTVEVQRIEPVAVDAGGAVLITEDNLGVAALLADKLTKLGVSCETLANPGAFSGNGANGLHSAEASIQMAIDAARARHGSIAALVHLTPLNPAPPESQADGSPGEFQKRLDAELKPLFFACKHVAASIREAHGTVLVATSMGGSFACGTASLPDAFWPGSGAVCGFVKALGREWPEVSCKGVDFDLQRSPEQIAHALAAELTHRDGLFEVGYAGDRRLTLQSVPDPVSSPASTEVLTPEDVVLITGGARGITAEIALEIAQRFRPTLILVGRTPLSSDEEPATVGIAEGKDLKAVLMQKLQATGIKPTAVAVEAEHTRISRQREVRAHVAALSKTGARVEYHAVDVVDALTFGAFIQDVSSRFGRLDAVIHGAGVIEDKLVTDKSPESFNRVLEPKISGALTICRALGEVKPRFVAFFSSVSARYGNRGQTDYAAANEVLNKLAAWMRARSSTRVFSVDWGPWESPKGMVTAELAQRFTKAGVQMVSLASGRNAFVAELASGSTETEVVWGGPIPTAAPSKPARSSTDSIKLPILVTADVIASSSSALDLSVETDIYSHVHLLDHQLSGTPVMPMAMVLELCAETAARGWPGLEVNAVRDFQVLQGITYPHGIDRTLFVQSAAKAPELDGNQIVTFSVCSAANPDQMHYRGEVEMRSSRQHAIVTPGLQLVNPKKLSMSIEEAYNNWLFHGERYAGIIDVEALGENGITGYLRTSSPGDLIPRSAGHHWLIDPVMVDSGLQMLILWARTYLDMTPLPGGLGCYHLIVPSPQGVIRCEAEISHSRGNPILRSDLRFFEESGRCVGWMDGMRVTCSRELNRLAQPRAARA